MNKYLAMLAALIALTSFNASATDDAAYGHQLYLGSLPGTYACTGCHNVNDKSTEQNKLFRGAAGDPDLIDFAINNNPDSTAQMRPLYGIGSPYELSDSDMSDLAAYIDSVVNPGGSGPTTPTFKSSPTSSGFGTVGVGLQSAAATFTITNTGASGQLTSVASSNNTEFLLAGGTCLATPKVLAQNASCTVQVIFAPTLSGGRSSTITILNNGAPNPLTIALAGTGGTSAPAQGRLSVPGSAAFGSQTLFVQSAIKTLTLQNIGTATATIFNVGNSNSGEFPLISTTCSGAVPVNATCTIDVAFRPTTAGARSATLSISSDGIGNPQGIALSGTGAGAGGGGPGSRITVVEYYNASYNHYFMTPNAIEIGLLGKPPFDAWQPTGFSFSAYAPAGAPAGTVGICRFYNDHFLGISTHFYAPHGLGCEATITMFPDWTLEDPQLFYAYVPDIAGNCPGTSVPVYRLYNNAMGGAPNHRFTTSAAVRQQMLDKGYTPEGYGIGVGMCVPQ